MRRRPDAVRAAGAPAPRKSLGQHFLHDARVIGRIVAAVDAAPGDHVVEIGPGMGALTTSLLARCGRLDVIEIDRVLAARLRETIHDERLAVHAVDALRFDYATLAGDGQPLRLVGNLPYNISTPLLFHLLEQAALFRDLHVMLQKEVVDRMVAPPGSRTYGRLSVALAARCRLTKLFDIGAGAFTPPPKVRSSFVRLTPDAALAGRILDEATLNRLLAQAFSMRRKRLGNALRGLLDDGQILAAGADPDARPERISPAQFVALANLQANQQASLVQNRDGNRG